MNFTCNAELTINNNSVGIATDYVLDGRSSNPSRGKVLLLSTASRPTLGPTQPPFQWVSEAISPGVKRPGSEADNSLPSSAEVHSPIRLHGIMIN
jgi:hypothetical protein